MATKEKGKKGKEKEKSAKKVEEPVEEKKIEIPTPVSEPVIQESLSEELQVVVDEPPVKEPEPEPVYDEPVLPELIIQMYEGGKSRGQYDGEGCAFFKGGHIYQGQFEEGFMHGQGKYIWSDGLKYTGDFFKNQVMGKGIYEWPDGSAYEGDVVRGKRHGQGTFYCKGRLMSYTGDWDQGVRTGKGRVDYDPEGKSFYEGDMMDNVRHGWGVRQYPSGNVYKGMWFNNVRHGQGTMKWINRNQIYTGQWEDGIQHGMGQHIWLLTRVSSSQYPMRNMYDGEFVNGLRHGFGSFHYANGACYTGFWKNNMKHGKGKFMFKNGRVYEGLFEHDHIVEYPEFSMDGMSSPDMGAIRTRTPVPSDNMSVDSNESRNTVSPNFQLDIDYLLAQMPDADREEEASQVLFVITRHISCLRKVYTFYSKLGYDDSADNTYTMTRMQFWRMAKDCGFHNSGVHLTSMDRLIGQHYNRANFQLHNPYERILQRQFVNYLVIIAHQINGKRFQGTSPLLGTCLNTLITENILPSACNVRGYFYYETRRAVNALVYMDQTYEIFQMLSRPRKLPPRDPAFRTRDFLFLLNDLKLINETLTATRIVDVLSIDDRLVCDKEGCYNMEGEMTFLEFFEGLVGCAEIYATEDVVKESSTPGLSTNFTRDPSPYSAAGPPSGIPSQMNLDAISPGLVSGASRAQSSAPGTAKTATEGSAKTGEGTSVGTMLIASADPVPPDPIAVTAEIRKTASRHSSFSVGTAPENQPLLVSQGSFSAQEDLDAADSMPGEEVDEVEEATRLFNFWTHQVHVFLVNKFFTAANHLILIHKLLEARRLKEEKRRVSEALSAASVTQETPVTSAVDNVAPSQVPSSPKVEEELAVESTLAVEAQ